MINIALDSLLQFMRTQNYEAEIQEDTGQVYTILKINQKEYPVFLRVFDEGHLLQLLAFLPCYLETNALFTPEKKEEALNQEVPQKRDQSIIIADLARLLHILNKELDVPGFGMDERAGVVFYRLMIPAPRKKIESELLAALLKTIEHVCQMFSVPIEAVSSGQMTLEQILEKAQEMESS